MFHTIRIKNFFFQRQLPRIPAITVQTCHFVISLSLNLGWPCDVFSLLKSGGENNVLGLLQVRILRDLKAYDFVILGTKAWRELLNDERSPWGGGRREEEVEERLEGREVETQTAPAKLGVIQESLCGVEDHSAKRAEPRELWEQILNHCCLSHWIRRQLPLP